LARHHDPRIEYAVDAKTRPASDVDVETLPLVVLVDDDPDELFFVKRALRTAGAANRVLTFDDGEPVMAFLREYCAAPQGKPTMRPCLLVLDIKMPGVGGFAVLKWVRSQRELAGLHVVMHSTSDDPRDVELSKAFGADDFLRKPVQPEHWAELISRFKCSAAV
jgi:CheY-like chemotaxis protein